MKQKLLAALLLVAVVSAMVVGVASAHTEAIEWMDNPNSWRYSLDYIGIGYGDCDDNDRAFAIVKTFSADPANYRLNSTNWLVTQAFQGKSPYGHNLETAYDAYMCVGLTEVVLAGGVPNIENNLFVWVQ